LVVVTAVRVVVRTVDVSVVVALLVVEGTAVAAALVAAVGVVVATEATVAGWSGAFVT
jgi:hypothetical protein